MKSNVAANNERPKLEIKPGYWDQVMDIVSWAGLVVLGGFGMYLLGISTDSESAIAVKVLVPLAIAIIVGFHFLKKIPDKFNYLVPITPQNAQRQYTIAVRMLRVISLMILLDFAVVLLVIYLEETRSIEPNEGLIALVVFGGMLPLIYYVWQAMKK